MDRQRTLDEFETTDLLGAVDDVDNIRGMLADGEHLEPPKLREDLMKLHGLAMRVCNEGWDDERSELFELATEVEDEVEDIRDAANRILDVVRQLTEADFEEEEEDLDEEIIG